MGLMLLNLGVQIRTWLVFTVLVSADLGHASGFTHEETEAGEADRRPCSSCHSETLPCPGQMCPTLLQGLFASRLWDEMVE